MREVRAALAPYLAASPGDSNLLGDAAMIDAGLGNREAALREGEQAVSVVRADAMEAPSREVMLAQVCAQVGEIDRALRNLPRLLQTPGSSLTPALLRLDPVWDPVRRDPRFEKLATSAVQIRLGQISRP